MVQCTYLLTFGHWLYCALRHGFTYKSILAIEYKMKKQSCECGVGCIYKCVDLVYILGVITNIVVVWRVCVDKKLRSPTFVAIACLAFSDAAFLTMNIINAIDIIQSTTSCSKTRINNQAAFNTIVGITWFAANAHVTIIAVLRCVMILRPLESHVYLTNRKILIASGVVWLIGGCIWVTVFLFQKFEISSVGESLEFQLTIYGLVFISPVAITAVLHLIKCRYIRQISKDQQSNTVAMLKVYNRMSKMILLVILVAVVLQLPRIIYRLLPALDLDIQSKTVSLHVQGCCFLLFLLNSCINPVIYAFQSDRFRASLCKTIRKSNRSVSLTASGCKTNDTNIQSSPKCERVSDNVTRTMDSYACHFTDISQSSTHFDSSSNHSDKIDK